MDFETFKLYSRNKTLNCGQIFRIYKDYVDRCIEKGEEIDLDKIKSYDSYVDQFSLLQLSLFKEIGFDGKHSKAYQLRKSILSYIESRKKTQSLVENRAARRQFLNRQHDKTTSDTILTESRLVDDNSGQRPMKKKRTSRGKASRRSRRTQQILPHVNFEDDNCVICPNCIHCDICEGMGDITVDQFMSKHIFTESKDAPTAVMAVHGEVGNSETHENVTDHVGEQSEMVTDVGVNLHDSLSGLTTEYSLDNFFKRPVLIYQGDWAIGQTYDQRFSVWDLWSKDSSVRAKLSNYAFFKATCHVKIAFTGSPYHYGTAMASYQPYHEFNSQLDVYDSLQAGSANVGPSHTAYCCYLSQAPGTTYFDYKENRPKEMIIPFISHKQKFRLYNDDDTVITPLTSYHDLQEAGQLRLVSLNVPQDANDDNATGVGVAIYVWMTDVELGSITSTDTNITAESKVIFTESGVVTAAATMGKAVIDRYDQVKNNPDEYKEPGPVSKAATAVSAAASSMTTIPYIGPFAKATSTVSRMLGDVAFMFGFSRPLQIDDSQFRKNMPFINGATTSGKDTAYKIALDPKQELTIDQSIGGMDSDQMCIQEIAGRESFLTYFKWDQSNSALSSLLWKTLVLPGMFVPITGPVGANSNYYVQPTAMMFAAQPFSSWRGTIRFRFEVICSKFHRGKLLFKFDPNVPANALISFSSTRMNQQNVIILDIQEAQDLVIDIDWAHARDWALNKTMDAELPPNQLLLDSSGTGSSIKGDGIEDYAASQSNGFLEIRPFTTLVQPTASSSLYVNVFVSCPDLEVNRMTNEGMPIERAVFTESRDLTPQKINKTNSKVSERCFLNHYGERITSFRSLLKRYVTTHRHFGTPGVVGEYVQLTEGGMYPFDSLQAGVDNSPQDFLDRNNLFAYLKHAYLGMRGGYRHRLLTTTRAQNMGYTRISLDDGSNVAAVGRPVVQYFPYALFEQFSEAHSSNLNGTVLFHEATNGGVEFEMPYYSRNLFEFAFSNDYGQVEAVDRDLGYESILGSSTYFATRTYYFPDDSATIVTQIDTASAEDFTFLRFQGAPGFRARPGTGSFNAPASFGIIVGDWDTFNFIVPGDPNITPAWWATTFGSATSRVTFTALLTAAQTAGFWTTAIQNAFTNFLVSFATSWNTTTISYSGVGQAIGNHPNINPQWWGTTYGSPSTAIPIAQLVADATVAGFWTPANQADMLAAYP